MGCSSAPAEEEEGVAVDDITPHSPATIWTLAELCDGNITRHSAVKAQETAGGVVRWQCGDREGVDGDLDRGQEYCEYMAVSNGKKVTKAAEITKGKPLQCFFTSVYSDVDNQTVYDANGKNTYSSCGHFPTSLDVFPLMMPVRSEMDKRIERGLMKKNVVSFATVTAARLFDEKMTSSRPRAAASTRRSSTSFRPPQTRSRRTFAPCFAGRSTHLFLRAHAGNTHVRCSTTP